jgi:DNA-binding response OmpR family regulator
LGQAAAPAAAGPPKAFQRGAAVPDDAARTRGGRILVVDDEPHIRRVLEAMLGKEGFDVTVANDGEEGLVTIAAGGVDLVILDLLMPGASGLEVLAQIRTDPLRGALPVIILTAKGQDTDREAAFAGGANDFMTKPFSPKKLVARIREILGAR